MNIQSPKNKLIEYAFKTGVHSPVFETTRLGGPDHNPTFHTKLVFLGHIIESDGYGKKQAEYNVCTKFLSFVPLIKDSVSQLSDWMTTKDAFLKLVANYRVVHILDGDQLQEIPIGEEDKLNLIVCKYNNTNLYNRLKRYTPRLNVYVLECPIIGQDATDHYITFLVGMCKGLFPDVSVKVYSDDHFAEIVNKF